MGKIKLHELDLVRAAAIGAVVLLHGTSEGSAMPALGAAHVLLLAVNKMCAFAVPVFIFISGLVLSYGAQTMWDRARVISFYKRRMKSVLVPYLLWTAVYYGFNQWLAHGRNMAFDPLYIAKLLVTGNASYHLYFLVIIMQFYAVYPLLAYLFQRRDRTGRLLLAVGVLVQLGFYAFSRLVHPVPFSYLWGFGYAAFFALGGWFGSSYGARAEAAQRRTGSLALLAIALGLGYAGLNMLGEHGVALSDMWFELLYDGLGLAAGAALIGWSRRLMQGSPAGRMRAALKAIGQASFGIYLVHPIFLTLWREAVPLQSNGWRYILVNSLGLAIVLMASYAVVVLYARIKKSRTNVRI